MKFSVLISVYYKENPEFLKESLDSIWNKQTLKPNEIILIKDGPLKLELDNIISEFSSKTPVKIISLPQNMGLGIALAEGLKACSYEIIARMDTDDIASPDRFKKQIAFLKSNPAVSLLSSNIAEFIDNPSDIVSIRKVPCDHNEILSFAQTRNPMNHMAVMFKKSAVLDAGNYLPFCGYEDYYLWIRMLLKGYKTSNIPDNLVYVRIGNNMHQRRQGYTFFKQEIKLQKTFSSLCFISKYKFVKNIFYRALPRLMPVSILKLVYVQIRK